MLSQTVEYALRVVVFLASRKGDPAVTRQIAAATHVPEGYLSKVLQNLSRAGFVKSQRGLHGGSILGIAPEDLTVYDVIQSVDPISRIKTCPLGLQTHGSSLCPLHRRLDNAIKIMEEAFKACRVSDLLEEAGGSKPLCDDPNATVPPLVRLRVPVPMGISRSASAGIVSPPKRPRGRPPKKKV